MNKMSIRNSLYIYALVTLLLVGCSTSMDREGYGIWPYQPIIKDDENTLYVPIIDYDGHISDINEPGKLASATLYKLQSNSLIKTTHVLSDFAHSSAMDVFKLIDSGFGYINGINVDNKFHHIVIQVSNKGKYKNNPKYLVMEHDSIETKKLDKYIDTYYKGKINFKEILSDIRLKMSSEYKGYDYYLRISLYPDGLYIIYPSNEKVDYKSKTTKVRISGSPELKGYYVSYYRYYPVSNPINFTEVKLPLLIDIANR
jgi:hypothetical protein